MQISSRAAVIAAFGVGPLILLSGCGGGTTDAGTEATVARILPTSFVELPPVTTTTTTTLPIDGSGGGLATGEQQYTIKGGDTLGKIASRYGVSLDQLVGYNEFPNGSSQLILPGDVIKVPPGASIPGTVTEVSTDPATASANGGTDTAGEETADTTDTTDTAADDLGGEDCPTTYTIKSGDNTRIGVAEQFGISYEQMDAANAGTPGYSGFVVGTQITIPCP